MLRYQALLSEDVQGQPLPSWTQMLVDQFIGLKVLQIVLFPCEGQRAALALCVRGRDAPEPGQVLQDLRGLQLVPPLVGP